MKSTSITEFRKTFHKLDEPVIVTALGRPIGTYSPVSSAIDARVLDAIRPGEPMEHFVDAVSQTLDRQSSLRGVVHVASPARRGDADHLVPPKGK